MADDALKRKVALASLEYVATGGYVGVGSGTTVSHFIAALATIRHRIVGAVSSSEASTRLLRHHGIPVVALSEVTHLPLYVDGADESNDRLQLIKGGGGALTREKILRANADRFVCIADHSKLVSTLGAFPLPLEVIPMARSWVAREVIRLTGGEPVWRAGVVTDNGNQILDVHTLQIEDPVALEQQLNHIPGVVTNGLFARHPADVLLLASAGGVQELTAPTGGGQ